MAYIQTLSNVCIGVTAYKMMAIYWQPILVVYLLLTLFSVGLAGLGIYFIQHGPTFAWVILLIELVLPVWLLPLCFIASGIFFRQAYGLQTPKA